MQIEIKILNSLLADLNPWRISQNKEFKLLEQKDTHKGIPDYADGRQGEFNEETFYYSHKQLPNGVYIQVITRTDSYGNNDSIHSFQLVQPVEKVVTAYQPI